MKTEIQRNTHRQPRSCFRLWPCVCKGSTRRWTAGGDDYQNGLRDRKLDSELLQTHFSLILMFVAAMILLGQCLESTDQRYFPFLYLKKDTICPWETSPSACETQNSSLWLEEIHHNKHILSRLTLISPPRCLRGRWSLLAHLHRSHSDPVQGRCSHRRPFLTVIYY